MLVREIEFSSRHHDPVPTLNQPSMLGWRQEEFAFWFSYRNPYPGLSLEVVVIPGQDMLHFPTATILGVAIPLDPISPTHLYHGWSRRVDQQGLTKLGNIRIVPPDWGPIGLHHDVIFARVGTMEIANQRGE